MAQNYSTHRRFVPIYHYVLALFTLAVLIGAFVNLFKSVGTTGLYSASLIALMSLNGLLTFFFMRVFALKAQDRAIRAEENLRSFAATGKLLDPKLTTRQIVGLRFAGDDECAELAKKAAENNMSEDDIKKAIKNWKADEYRV